MSRKPAERLCRTANSASSSASVSRNGTPQRRASSRPSVVLPQCLMPARTTERAGTMLHDRVGAHDLGADAVVRENFEQQRMVDPAVDEVDLVDAGVQRFDAALDLRQHAAGEDLAQHEPVDLVGADGRDDRIGILAVGEHSRHVGWSAMANLHAAISALMW